MKVDILIHFLTPSHTVASPPDVPKSPEQESDSFPTTPTKPEPSSNIRDIIKLYQSRPLSEPKDYEPVR